MSKAHETSGHAGPQQGITRLGYEAHLDEEVHWHARQCGVGLLAVAPGIKPEFGLEEAPCTMQVDPDCLGGYIRVRMGIVALAAASKPGVSAEQSGECTCAQASLELSLLSMARQMGRRFLAGCRLRRWQLAGSASCRRRPPSRTGSFAAAAAARALARGIADGGAFAKPPSCTQECQH